MLITLHVNKSDYATTNSITKQNTPQLWNVYCGGKFGNTEELSKLAWEEVIKCHSE